LAKIGNLTGFAFSGGRTGAPFATFAFAAESTRVPVGLALPAASTGFAGLETGEGEEEGDVDVGVDDWDGV